MDTTRFVSGFRVRMQVAVASVLSLTAVWAGAAEFDMLKVAVEKRAESDYPYLDKLYKHLHANPELSLQEEKTAQRLAQELEQAGFTVTTKVGAHGIVGVLKNGEGPTILVRTDLDALPVKEETGAPYASQVQAKNEKGETVSAMHACGHDVHMTVFAGAARALAALKEHWRGTLVMIGQPAEERGKGARRMLADGLFTRFPKPDYCLALHASSTLPAGHVGYVEGHALANVDSVNVTIRGIGGHGAWPHTTKDPIVLAAQFIVALQTIVSRELPPTEPAVVTVGSIHGGTKHNIIPDEVKLQLTLRSYTDEVRNQTLESVHRISRGLAMAAGLPENRYPEVSLEDEFTPATYNHPELARRIAQTFQKWFGENRVVREQPVMGGEDFGEYGRTNDKIPICIFWLGTVDPAKHREHVEKGTPLPSLHSSKFLPLPEPAIKTGMIAMTAAVLELSRGSGNR